MNNNLTCLCNSISLILAIHFPWCEFVQHRGKYINTKWFHFANEIPHITCTFRSSGTFMLVIIKKKGTKYGHQTVRISSVIMVLTTQLGMVYKKRLCLALDDSAYMYVFADVMILHKMSKGLSDVLRVKVLKDCIAHDCDTQSPYSCMYV